MPRYGASAASRGLPCGAESQSMAGEDEMEIAGIGGYDDLAADREGGHGRGVTDVDVGQDRQSGQLRLAGDDLFEQRPGHVAGALEPAHDKAADAGRVRKLQQRGQVPGEMRWLRLAVV